MPSNFCPFVVNTVEAGISGQYHFLDGMIMTNACLSSELMYDVWKARVGTPLLHMLDVPRIHTPAAVDYFKDRLCRLVTALEHHFDIQITEAALQNAVSVHNRIREAMARIQALREEAIPRLSGFEFLALCNESYTMEKEAYLAHLDHRLSFFKSRDPIDTGHQKRIFLVGSKIFQDHIPEIVETEGGIIVSECMCSALKRFDGLVETTDEPLRSISDRYLGRTRCPRMHDRGQLYRTIRDTVDDYRIDGVIYYSAKCCASHALKGVEIREALKKENIPVLYIEDDYSNNGLEQIRTRIATFIEII